MKDERLESEIERFNSALIPFGYNDVKEAVKTALDGGHDGDWAAEQITQFMEDTETKLDDIDPNYVVYDALLQEARNDISDIAGIDILNDTKDQVNVYGNCTCTSLYFSDEAKEELTNILDEVPEDEYTDAIKWLISEVEYEKTINEGG